MTIHLTLTGYYAGHPLCGINKDSAELAGDKFAHYAYIYNRDGKLATDEEILNDPDICEDCKRELKESL